MKEKQRWFHVGNEINTIITHNETDEKYTAFPVVFVVYSCNRLIMFK